MVFAGVGTNFAPLFLGTTEGKPRVRLRPEYEPVFNDVAGPRVHFDECYVGFDAVVTGTFSRYAESVYEEMQKYSDNAGLPATVGPGFDQAGARGTLMLQEGAAYPLWLLFPFAAKASMRPGPPDGNLPAGYRFLSAMLIDDEFEPGMGPKKLTLSWHCLGDYFPGNTGGVFIVYDNNMTGLPAAT